MERITINLASLHVKKTRRGITWLCYFLLLVLLTAGGYEVWYFKEAKKTIAAYKTEINKQAAKKSTSAAPQNIYSGKDLKELESEIKIANQIILGDYFQCSILLDNLESAMPENLFLNQIDIDLENTDIKKLKIEANAQNFDDIVLFVNNLESSSFFINPFLLSQAEEEDLDGEKQLRFNITTDISYPNIF